MSIHDELQRIATATAQDPHNDELHDAFYELATPATALELLTEIRQLREMASAVATAVGASISAEHSTVEFISLLPSEVASVVERLTEDHDKQWRRAEVFGNNGVVLTEQVENRQQLLLQLARFIVMNTPRGFKDWGCKQCVTPLLTLDGNETFVCGFHQAQAILKEQPAS